MARPLADGAKAGVWTAVSIPKGTYQVRFWAMADVGKRAAVGAHLVGTVGPLSRAGGNWKQFTWAVTLDVDAQNATFRIFAATPGVRVWLDDVEVVPVPPG